MNIALVQRDSFYFSPGKSQSPLDVVETPHNIKIGQWYTYTVEGEKSSVSVVSFNQGFRIFPVWKERVGNCLVQRDKNGMVGAVKLEL